LLSLLSGQIVAVKVPTRCDFRLKWVPRFGTGGRSGVQRILESSGEEVSFLPDRRAESHGVCLRPTSTVGTDSSIPCTAFHRLAAEKHQNLCPNFCGFMARGQNTNDLMGGWACPWENRCQMRSTPLHLTGGCQKQFSNPTGHNNSNRFDSLQSSALMFYVSSAFEPIYYFIRVFHFYDKIIHYYLKTKDRRFSDVTNLKIYICSIKSNEKYYWYVSNLKISELKNVISYVFFLCELSSISEIRTDKSSLLLEFVLLLFLIQIFNIKIVNIYKINDIFFHTLRSSQH